MNTPLKSSIEAFGFSKSTPYIGDPDYFGLLAMQYTGNIIEARLVRYNQPPRLPWYLRGVFNELKNRNLPVQLITVRKAGVPEHEDGSHMHQFLIPADAVVPVSGFTF